MIDLNNERQQLMDSECISKELINSNGSYHARISIKHVVSFEEDLQCSL